MDTTLMTINETTPANQMNRVVLWDDEKRSLGVLLDTMKKVGVLRAVVHLSSHYCNCEYCDDVNVTVDTVQLVFNTGTREMFRNDDVSSNSPTSCPSFDRMPFDADDFTDFVVDFCFSNLLGEFELGWMELDTGRRMVDGGRLVKRGTRLEKSHEWTCDIRDSSGSENRLWD